MEVRFPAKWMDMVISQYDRPYLDRLMQYQHLVQQRNNLLRGYFAENRTWDPEQLEPWMSGWCRSRESIAAERTRFLAEFTPEFDRIHQSLCDGREQVGLSLSTKVEPGQFAMEALVAAPGRTIVGSGVRRRASTRTMSCSASGTTR